MPGLYYCFQFDGCSNMKYRIRAELPFQGPAPIGTELHVCCEEKEHGLGSFFAYVSGYEHYTPLHNDDPERNYHNRFPEARREYGDFYMTLSDSVKKPVLFFKENEEVAADKFSKFLERHGWEKYR